MNLDLVYPMAALVLLTFVILGMTLRARVRALKAGEADVGYYKTYQEGKEPREVAQLSRHVANLFESPTLFYAACIVGMITGQNAGLLIVLAWVYVGTRVIHAYVHTGSNSLLPRMGIYFASCFVLFGMWSTLVVGVATSQ